MKKTWNKKIYFLSATLIIILAIIVAQHIYKIKNTENETTHTTNTNIIEYPIKSAKEIINSKEEDRGKGLTFVGYVVKAELVKQGELDYYIIVVTDDPFDLVNNVVFKLDDTSKEISSLDIITIKGFYFGKETYSISGNNAKDMHTVYAKELISLIN